MKSDELRRIAEHSGTSISTVRRVLSHCSGITEELRHTVIRAQESQNISSHAEHTHRVSVILPDNPKFFWHRAFDVFNSHPFSPPAKFSFYPSLAQHTMLKTYLEPLVSRNGSVLIYSANLNAEECDLVAQIAKHSLVIQLGEYTPIPHTVFVGSGAYDEGVRLGSLASAAVEHPCVVLLERKENINMCERCRGFIDGLGAGATVHRLPEPEEQPLYSSLLARLLSEIPDTIHFVFSPSGRTAELCSALHKLRNHTEARAIGYELSSPFKKQQSTAPLFAVIEQNIAEQTRIALRLADAYLSDGSLPECNEYITPPYALWQLKNGILTK